MSGDDKNLNLETQASQAAPEIVPATGPIASYLAWAEKQQPNRLYAVMCIMACAVHDMARYGFHLRQREYPMSLWVALAGDSASGKSTAIRQARKFVEDAWTEANILFPTSPWIETDGSIAGILAVLSDLYDPHRQTTVSMMFHHELSAVLNTREPVAEMLCRLADGLDYERNLRELQKNGKRVKGGADRIHAPVLSGLFASTEVSLARVFNEAHKAGGLFSRFCWVAPPFSRADARFKRDTKTEDDPLYKTAVDHWAGWLGMIGLVDREICLSPAAEDVLEAFFQEQTACLKEHDAMNGPRIRLVEKARVFAAVFAVQQQNSVVSEADMRHACALANLLIEHAETLSDLGADPVVRKVQRAQEMIEQSGDIGVSRRILYERLGISRRLMDEVIATLLDAGLAIEHKPRGSGPTTLVSAESTRGKQLAKLTELFSGTTGDTTGNIGDTGQQ